ncbi:hypothetical protein SAMN05428989_0652 [Pseudoxanthomonas sp. GM95]|uniref:hypothetical protein n=1 Tax=Pseudoxanthomonas sp. GM95 TaxID=1881043 RepID=UPI0008C5C507|nr:hypothetical protein [Pseudoxanthomonas sp. GM95]SEK71336.1 hypothetical protein SAMN05428989_0652 [Pseudoxanthomonas sp. GM95]
MLLQGRAVRHAARRLPQGLAVEGLREGSGLLPLLLPLRRGCSGAVVFQLAAATVRALRERPRELLGEAPSPRAQDAAGYRPWRALHSARYGLLWLSAQRERSAWLVVAPDEGVAVYLWRGRRAVNWRHDFA